MKPEQRGPDRTDTAIAHAASWRPCLALLVLLIATSGIYLGTVEHGFVWDDRDNFVENARVREWSAANLAGFWREPWNGLWIPLTYNVLSAVAQLAATPPTVLDSAGLDPRWFHASNLLLHCAAVSLVFALLRGLTASTARSLLGAALFAWHPLMVEPVAWASGIKDLLSSTLALAALTVYLAPTTAMATRRWPRRAVATLLFALALTAKPAVIPLPLVALAIQVGVQRRPWWDGAPWLALWLGLAMIAAAITNSGHQEVMSAPQAAPIWMRPLIAADAAAFYVAKLFWPTSLAPVYGRTPEFVMESNAVWWTWLAPLALMIAAWWTRARRWPGTALAVSGLFLLPVLGLVPFRFQMYSTVADRYFYLAMLGASLALALGLPRGSNGEISRRAFAVVAVALLVLAGLSYRQTAVWEDNLSLWGHAVRIEPDAALAQHNLGHFLARAGRSAEAELHLRRALELDPHYANAMNSLGNLLLDRDDPRSAIPYYREARVLTPEDGRIAYNLGNAYSRIGDFDAAAEQYLAAIETPRYRDDSRALYGLGVARLEQKRFADAEQSLARVVHLDPNFAEARARLGAAQEALGRVEEALASYRAALYLDPNAAEVRARIEALAPAN